MHARCLGGVVCMLLPELAVCGGAPAVPMASRGFSAVAQLTATVTPALAEVTDREAVPQI
jgi:hypothetical protein